MYTDGIALMSCLLAAIVDNGRTMLKQCNQLSSWNETGKKMYHDYDLVPAGERLVHEMWEIMEKIGEFIVLKILHLQRSWWIYYYEWIRE